MRRIFAAVATLKGALEATIDSHKPAAACSQVEGRSTSASQNGKDTDDQVPRVNEVERLRIVDVSIDWQRVERLLSATINEQAQVAWSEGLSLCHGPHQLFVTLGTAASPDVDDTRWDGASPYAQAVYEDSRAWWERCLLGLPQRG